MNQFRVWGGLKLLKDGSTEIVWEGEPLQHVNQQVQPIGTVYGVDWDFAGDVGLEGDIFVEDVFRKINWSFSGRRALLDFKEWITL
jgi:hypothetical protein